MRFKDFVPGMKVVVREYRYNESKNEFEELFISATVKGKSPVPGTKRVYLELTADNGYTNYRWHHDGTSTEIYIKNFEDILTVGQAATITYFD
jgi:hypothetical protein